LTVATRLNATFSESHSDPLLLSDVVSAPFAATDLAQETQGQARRA